MIINIIYLKACYSEDKLVDNNNFLVKKDVVKVSFPLKENFILLKGMRGNSGGLPLEHFQHLYIYNYKTKEKKEIELLNDLKNFVKINDKSQALSFVRLLTSPETHYLFKKFNKIEVFRKGDIKEALIGIISDELFKKLKLKELEIKSEDNKYIIERNLITYPQENKGRRLIRVIEEVKSNGEYVILDSKEITKGEILNDIFLPYYE